MDVDSKALLIAGGVWQIPIAAFLRQRGFHLTIVDPNTNPPALKKGDEHVACDVRDVDEIIERLKFRPSIITTDQSDIAVETVAKLTEYYGLFGNDLSAVIKFSNKLANREAANKLGIPIPNFEKISSVEELQHGLNIAKKSKIFKPADAQSSRGIRVFSEGQYSIGSLKEFYDEAMRHSKSKTGILEDFFEGQEITIEGYLDRDGVHHNLALSEKDHFRTGIASDLHYSSPDREGPFSKILETNDKFIESSGLKFGITHSEFLQNEQKDEYILVESACRGGGNLISSDIIPLVSGIDVQSCLISDLLAESYVKHPEEAISKDFVSLHFFELEGMFKIQSSDIDMLRKIKGVHALDFFVSEGEVLTRAADDRSRHGFVIVKARSSEDCRRIISELDRKVNNLNK